MIYEIHSYKIIRNANESIVIQSRSVVALREGTEAGGKYYKGA